jgi:hypothetical protein
MTLLRISSLNKKPESNSNTDFSVNFGNGDVVQGTNRIIVKSIDIPNVFYNLRNDVFTNKTEFTYEIAGAPTTIVLPEGQYTITQLITALTTDVTLAALGLAITKNAITGRLEFTSTTPMEFLSQADGNGMASVLGILVGSGGDVLAFNATGFPDLSGVQEIYITSPELADGSNLITNGGLTFSVLAHIPMTVDFDEIEHWRAYDANLEEITYLSYDTGKNIRDVTIQVRDRHGDILDLQGLNVTIILDAFRPEPTL